MPQGFTSSAEPIQLGNFGARSQGLAADLGSEASHLRGALEHFSSRCSEGQFRVSVGGLDSALRNHAAHAEGLGRWVANVGQNFEIADSGVGLLGAVPEMYSQTSDGDGLTEDEEGFEKTIEANEKLAAFIAKMLRLFGAQDGNGNPYGQPTPEPTLPQDPWWQRWGDWLKDWWHDQIGDDWGPTEPQLESAWIDDALTFAWLQPGLDGLNDWIKSINPFTSNGQDGVDVISPLPSQPDMPDKPTVTFGDLIDDDEDDDGGYFEKLIEDDGEDDHSGDGSLGGSSDPGAGPSIQVPKPPPDIPEMTATIGKVYLPPAMKQPDRSYLCGPYSAAMMIAYYHSLDSSNPDLSVDAIMQALGDSLGAKGIPADELAERLDALDGYQAEHRLHTTMEELKALLEDGPVMANVHLSLAETGTAHMIVLTGISSDGKTVYYNDPWTGKISECSWDKFEKSFNSTSYDGKEYPGSEGSIVVLRPE